MSIFDKISQNFNKLKFIIENKAFHGFSDFNYAVADFLSKYIEKNPADTDGVKKILDDFENKFGAETALSSLKNNRYFSIVHAIYAKNSDLVSLLVEKAEQLGGREEVLNIFNSRAEKFFLNVVQKNDDKTFGYLINKAEEVGGINLVKQILQHRTYTIFQNDEYFGNPNSTKLLKIAFDKSDKCGILKDALSANNYKAFSFEVFSNHHENTMVVYNNLEKVGHETLAEATQIIINRVKTDRGVYSIEKHGKDAILNIYAQKSFPLELRQEMGEVLQRVISERSGLNSFLESRKIKILDDKNFGKAGQGNPYASGLLAVSKIAFLHDNFHDEGLDIVKILKNYNAGDGILMSWEKVSEADKVVTFSDIQQLTDIKEAIKYTAYNLVANKFAEEGQLNNLKNIDTEHFDKFMNVLVKDITKKCLEEKTLGQMCKISEQWHSHRAALVKAADNTNEVKTLRDFAPEGKWEQTTLNKITTPTDKDLKGYTIVNLTSSNELQAEGDALAHCVSSYVDKCNENGYQVFSIRKDGKPVSTLGYTVVDGNLHFDQHYGYKNANISPNSKEAKVRNWFEKNINSPEVQIDLSSVGEVKYDKKYSVFENAIGIKFENINPERIQANLNILSGFAKENIHKPERNVYLFGKANAGLKVNELAEGLGVLSLLDVGFQDTMQHIKPIPEITQQKQVKKPVQIINNKNNGENVDNNGNRQNQADRHSSFSFSSR